VLPGGGLVKLPKKATLPYIPQKSLEMPEHLGEIKIL
jgi:hypothetical protein